MKIQESFETFVSHFNSITFFFCQLYRLPSSLLKNVYPHKSKTYPCNLSSINCVSINFDLFDDIRSFCRSFRRLTLISRDVLACPRILWKESVSEQKVCFFSFVSLLSNHRSETGWINSRNFNFNSIRFLLISSSALWDLAATIFYIRHAGNYVRQHAFQINELFVLQSKTCQDSSLAESMIQPAIHGNTKKEMMQILMKFFRLQRFIIYGKSFLLTNDGLIR